MAVTAPSQVDLELFDHGSCPDAAGLYGTAFCLATRKPGICKGGHRAGTAAAPAKVIAPPKLAAVPNAPAAKTDAQRIAQEQAAASYTQAMQHAQELARQLGARAGQRHAGVQAAVRDYAGALHQHGQAVKAEDNARTHAQKAHDTAQARNAATQAHYAAQVARAKAKTHAVAKHAALKRAVHVAQFPLTYPSPAGLSSSGWAAEADLYALPGAEFEELYALVAAPHWMCGVDQFCRNPLHPGPCKGWKHTLHAVAPGAYHAYEQDRVAKANAKRVAKIKALQALGSPVPKSLLKEITYVAPTKPQPGFIPPTPKEAVAALPATKAEIGAKLDLKNAAAKQTEQADAAKKLDLQHAALINAAEALGTHPNASAVKKKMIDIAASQKAKGESLTSHPIMQATIKGITEAASAKAGGLHGDEKTKIQKDVSDHVEAGATGIPGSIKSVLEGHKAKQAASAAAMEESAHQGHLSVTEAKDRIHKAYLDITKSDPENNWVMLDDLRSHPLLKDVPKDQVDAALKDMLKNHGEHFDIIPESNQKVLTKSQKDASVKIGNQDQHLISIDHGFDAKAGGAEPAVSKPKATGALAHPDMMAAVDMAGPGFTHQEKLHALQKPGVTKAEFEKLGPSGQQKIKDAIGAAHAANHSTVTTQAIADKLGLGHPALLGNQPITGEKAIVGPHAGKIGPAVTGGHPDGAKFIQALNDAKTTGQKFDVIDTRLTKKMYDAMPPAAKQQVHAVLIAMHQYQPDNVQAIAGAFGIPLPASRKIGVAGLTGHVKAAHDAAVGGVYATDTAKLQHYGALSPAEFQSLPAPARQKILEDLAGMHDKFLSPQKTGKAKTLHDSFHAAHVATAPSSGAGGGTRPHEEALGQKVSQMATAAALISGLAHGKTWTEGELAKKHENAVSLFESEGMNGPGMAASHSDTAQLLADGYSSIWVKKHFDHTVPALTPEQKSGLQAKASSEMKSLILAGSTKPIDGGVMDAFQKGMPVSDILAAAGLQMPGTPQAGAGGVNHLHEPSVSMDANEGAQAVQVITDLAGVSSPDAQVVHSATAKLLEHAIGTKSLPQIAGMLAEGAANSWADKHFPNGGGLFTPAEVQAVKMKAQQEMQDMIENGQVLPKHGGVLYAVKNGYPYGEVLALAKAKALTPVHHAEAHAAVHAIAHGSYVPSMAKIDEMHSKGLPEEVSKIVTPAFVEKWAERNLHSLGLSDHETSVIKNKAQAEMTQMITLGESLPPKNGVLEAVQNQPSGGLAVALKTIVGLGAVPNAKPGGLGKGTTLKGLSEGHQQEILGAFKMQPKGAQLSEPVEENFKSALNVAHGLSGQPGMGKLSLIQVLKAIDAQHSKNLGVTNSGLLEQKITSWLASAEGKAFAKSAKPDPAVAQALGSGIQLPAGTKIGKGEKVQKVGGPGKFDANVSSDQFKAFSPYEAQAEQDAYMAKTGEKWTPAQKAALTSYTIASGSMNGYLRGESSADPSTKQSIIEAQAGMRPLTHYHLLRRGTGFVQLPEQYRSHEGAKAMIGKTITDPAFLSTSVASGGFPGDGLVLEIEAPPGTMGAYVDGISKFSGEQEMLLAAGTKMRVIGVRDEYGTTVMRVRVVS